MSHSVDFVSLFDSGGPAPGSLHGLCIVSVIRISFSIDKLFHKTHTSSAYSRSLVLNFLCAKMAEV